MTLNQILKELNVEKMKLANVIEEKGLENNETIKNCFQKMTQLEIELIGIKNKLSSLISSKKEDN